MHPLFTKLMMIFVFLVILNLTNYGQETMLSVKFSELTKDQTANFKNRDAQIIIETKDADEAKQLIKDLRITKKPDDLSLESAHIKPRALPAENNIIFDIKTSDFAGDKEVTWAFLHKANKLANLKVTKLELSTGTNPQGKVVRYTPEIPQDFTVIGEDTKAPTSEPKFSTPTGITYIDASSPENNNRLVYSFCEGTLKFKKTKKSEKFRPLVGSPLSIELTPVPNPLRYEISISSKYNNYGTDTDPLLEQLLLNPSQFLPKAQAGSGDKELTQDEKKRKEKILGYLYRINANLIEFMDYYLYQADCVDPADFIKKKNTIEGNINSKLSAESDLKYPGNLVDFVKIEFHDYDSSIVKPFIQTYQKFKNLNITPFVFEIPRLKNADELSVNLIIRPKEKSNASRMVDSMDVDIPVFGGFKVDISPGIFYSFFSTDQYSLYNDSSMVKGQMGQDSVTSRFKSIQKESISKNDIGFSSLIHFYPRIGRGFNISANLGVGVTISDKPEVRYLTGLSFLIGRINRLAFSTGWAFGKVDEISDRYLEGSRFQKVNSSETKLETKKNLKSGMFIALSYNIPLLNRKQTPKPVETTTKP